MPQDSFAYIAADISMYLSMLLRMTSGYALEASIKEIWQCRHRATRHVGVSLERQASLGDDIFASRNGRRAA